MIAFLLILKIFNTKITDAFEAVRTYFTDLKPFGENDVNEQIDIYWQTLDDHDLAWSMKEEDQFRTIFSQKYNGLVYDMMDDYSY